MSRTYIGEFIIQKIVVDFDGPKSYVQVYKEETQDGYKYIAITKDKQEYALEQDSEDGFSMTIGEDTYIVFPEAGDQPDL